MHRGVVLRESFRGVLSYTPFDVTSDTSIVVAGLRNRLGASNAVLKSVATKQVVALATPPLFFEHEDVLKRAEHRLIHRLTLWGGVSRNAECPCHMIAVSQRDAPPSVEMPRMECGKERYYENRFEVKKRDCNH